MKKHTVLIIEDDQLLSESLSTSLKESGYRVRTASDGEAAVDYLLRSRLPQIVLLGLRFPNESPIEIATQVKSIADMPILFMANADDQEIIADGLKKFAEDFLVKPFEIWELEARIKMVLEGIPTLDYGNEPSVRIDDNLEIDLAHNKIIVGGKTMGLTPIESSLLHVLLRNAPRVVGSSTLLARAWPSEDVYEDTLRVQMHRLRRKIEEDAHHPHYIRTERGVGYRFAQLPALEDDDDD